MRSLSRSTAVVLSFGQRPALEWCVALAGLMWQLCMAVRCRNSDSDTAIALLRCSETLPLSPPHHDICSTHFEIYGRTFTSCRMHLICGCIQIGNDEPSSRT